MRVAIGALARTGIETHLGDDVPVAVRAALFHYAGKLRAGRSPVEYPSFLLGEGLRASDEIVEVEVDGEVEAVILAEAERQEKAPEQIAGHAVLVYLAELDSLTSEQTSSGGATPERGLTE